MSPKFLLVWQIAELEAGIEVMEAMIEHGIQQKWRKSDIERAVSRIVCLCRGFRGIHGVRRIGIWAEKREYVQSFKQQSDGVD